MADLQTRLAELASAVANPKSRLEYYLGLGKKVVGCFPAYTPEELVHASGMIPMGLWGAQTEWKEVKRYLPAFACPIMQSNLELGLRGAYKGLSAVIIPTLCDTFRCISQDWRFAVTDIPMVPVTQPQNNANDGSTDFLVAEYEAVLTKLSVLTGMKMTDAALEETIEIYNEHSRLMQEFTRVANDHLDIITPTIRHIIMKSAQFYEKAEHSAVMKDIIAGLNGLAKYEFTGKKVILSGITAEPTEILDKVMDFFPRLDQSPKTACPSRRGASPRMSSPATGRSILMTSAPKSASIAVEPGPARLFVKSTTRIPSKIFAMV